MPPLLENVLMMRNIVEGRKLIETQADLWLRKLIEKNVVLMVAAIANKINVHDLIKPSQLMIMENTLSQVRKVKQSFDRAVDDKNFSLKTDNITVHFERASETRMISTRNDLLSLVYDDVVEYEVEIALSLNEKYEGSRK